MIRNIKTSLNYTSDVVGFIKENPALEVKLPRYDRSIRGALISNGIVHDEVIE